MNNKNLISRRIALKYMSAATLAASLPACASKVIKLSKTNEKDISPIDRTVADIAPAVFSGDNPDRSHQLLWDIPGYINKNGGVIPEPKERAKVVIVGGGMSGIISAYLLRKHNPIVLERADRFGGNARGESWRGIDYSLGAAYLMDAPEESELGKFLKETGIDKLCRIKDADDPVVLMGNTYTTFWDGVTDPKNKEQFVKLKKYFLNVLNEKEGCFFPDIPIRDKKLKNKTNQLDKITFKEHLEKYVGGKLHPHIETALEHYCWSSFASTFSEVSAARGLNFYAAEFGKVNVPPGGNSAVAELLLNKTKETVPNSNFRSSSIVFNVKVVKDGVVVSYQDENLKMQSIHAETVIMACPKFVVARILNSIEPKRVDAIHQLRYRSYVVGNVMINKPIKNDFYDLFLVGRGNGDTKNIYDAYAEQGITDIVLATFAKSNSESSVLTLYRGIPFDGARSVLYAPDSYAKIKEQFKKQIHEEILPYVGVDLKNVVDVRLSRWGHPIPTAQKGFLSSGAPDQLRKPFKNRVFFVEQDNWAMPAFETAATEALYFAPKVEKVLSKINTGVE